MASPNHVVVACHLFVRHACSLTIFRSIYSYHYITASRKLRLLESFFEPTIMTAPHRGGSISPVIPCALSPEDPQNRCSHYLLQRSNERGFDAPRSQLPPPRPEHDFSGGANGQNQMPYFLLNFPIIPLVPQATTHLLDQSKVPRELEGRSNGPNRPFISPMPPDDAPLRVPPVRQSPNDGSSASPFIPPMPPLTPIVLNKPLPTPILDFGWLDPLDEVHPALHFKNFVSPFVMWDIRNKFYGINFSGLYNNCIDDNVLNHPQTHIKLCHPAIPWVFVLSRNEGLKIRDLVTGIQEKFQTEVTTESLEHFDFVGFTKAHLIAQNRVGVKWEDFLGEEVYFRGILPLSHRDRDGQRVWMIHLVSKQFILDKLHS